VSNGTDIRAVVLAAGRSTRFGANKLLAPFGRGPLLRGALAAAADACPGKVVLVTGFDAGRVVEVATPQADIIVHNPDFDHGMGSSIARGVEACRGEADAVIVLLADQPLVTAKHLRAIIANWSGSTGDIVASRYASRLGAPALFGSGLFDELCALQGDRGARDLLRSGRYRVVAVDCEAAAIDIDTRDDLARCLNSGP